jgi:hypothetical protein
MPHRFFPLSTCDDCHDVHATSMREIDAFVVHHPRQFKPTKPQQVSGLRKKTSGSEDLIHMTIRI